MVTDALPSVTGSQKTLAENVKPYTGSSLSGEAFLGHWKRSESVVIDIDRLMEWSVRRPEDYHSIREYLSLFTEFLGVSPRVVNSVVIAIDIDRLMEWLARMVRIENPHSIREYLLRFTELLDVIPQAVDAAKKHFPEAQLAMDVYQDPEIDDCYLVLYIRLKHYDDSVVERLEKAEAEFLNQLVHKRGWIQLTTDFREPEEERGL
jgi:hypothetical protein